MFLSQFTHCLRDSALDLIEPGYAERVRAANEAIPRRRGTLSLTLGGEPFTYEGQVTKAGTHCLGWGVTRDATGALDYEGEWRPGARKPGVYHGYGRQYDNGTTFVGEFVKDEACGPGVFLTQSGVAECSGVVGPVTASTIGITGEMTSYDAQGRITGRFPTDNGEWHGCGAARMETDTEWHFNQGYCEYGELVWGRRLMHHKVTGVERHVHGSRFYENECWQGKELVFHRDGRIDMFPIRDGRKVFHAMLNYTLWVRVADLHRDALDVVSQFLTARERHRLQAACRRLSDTMRPILSRARAHRRRLDASPDNA